MTDTNTAPAGDAAEFNATPISDAITGSDRHEAQERHTPHQEVGVDADSGVAPAPAVSAAPAPKTPAAPAAPSAPAAQAGEVDPAADPKGPRWYRDHMAKKNRETADLRAELERVRSGRAPPAPQPQDPPAIPDPVDDPQGYHDAMTSRFERRQQEIELKQTLSFSERFARREHGNEAFEECHAWLSTKPELADWCVMQPDPWSAAFSQFKREQMVEEIGDDPNAWRERETARIRAELLAEMNPDGDEPRQHIPAKTTMTRPTPPRPASEVRSAAPRDGSGRFAPTPLGGILGRKAS